MKTSLSFSTLAGLIIPLSHIHKKVKCSVKYKNVFFYEKSRLYGHNVFEGYNTVRKNVTIYNTYWGLGSYVYDRSVVMGARIGRFSSIGHGVKIYVGSFPSLGFIHNSPIFMMNMKPHISYTFWEGEERYPSYRRSTKNYAVSIGNDVWIGNESHIVDGITIGDGAIVLGGSKVDRDIEPYSIVSGSPAVVRKKRFKEEHIDFLLKFRWWDRDLDWLSRHYVEMDDMESFYEKYKYLN